MRIWQSSGAILGQLVELKLGALNIFCGLGTLTGLLRVVLTKPAKFLPVFADAGAKL